MGLIAAVASKRVVIISDCGITLSAYSCMSRSAVARLQDKYGMGHDVEEVTLTFDEAACGSWLTANVSDIDIAIPSNHY